MKWICLCTSMCKSGLRWCILAIKPRWQNRHVVTSSPLSWACHVLQDGEKLRMRVCFVCMGTGRSLWPWVEAVLSGLYRGDEHQRWRRVEGLKLRDRLTACWLSTPLEARQAACDLPAETLEVRQGDSSPVPWTLRGQWHQGGVSQWGLSSPPASTFCTRSVPVNLSLSNNLWIIYCTPTMFLELCWALYSYCLLYTPNSLFCSFLNKWFSSFIAM